MDLRLWMRWQRCDRCVQGVTFLLVLLLAGCTAKRPKAYSVLPEVTDSKNLQTQAQRALTRLYPPSYRATQRAIITVRKKEYVCDGVLTASPEKGLHLAVVSTLGLVTELQVNTNRSSELLRTTPLFPEQWSRDFVARDLRRLFMPRLDAANTGRLADGRFVLETPPTPEGYMIRYIFDPHAERLQEVEVEQRGSRMYKATIRNYRKFSAFPREIPSEIMVEAPSYKLNLRTAAVSSPQFTSSTIHP